jgi:K+-transporting ATPase ATPase A chain
MTFLGIAQIVVFFLIVFALTKPVGLFMYHVFEGERTFLHPIIRPFERLIYWLGGVREDEEQSWLAYAASMISFSIFSVLFVYVIQRLQGHLPLNPMHFSTPNAPQNATPMTPDLAFNTAVSFLTNTNWQSYVPDTTVSYFTNMVALAVQNFVSAAVGIAVAIALIRGFARHALHPDSHLRRGHVALGLARVAPNFQRARYRNHLGRHHSSDRARPRGVARSHQDARHQWWRNF